MTDSDIISVIRSIILYFDVRGFTGLVETNQDFRSYAPYYLRMLQRQLYTHLCHVRESLAPSSAEEALRPHFKPLGDGGLYIFRLSPGR